MGQKNEATWWKGELGERCAARMRLQPCQRFHYIQNSVLPGFLFNQAALDFDPACQRNRAKEQIIVRSPWGGKIHRTDHLSTCYPHCMFSPSKNTKNRFYLRPARWCLPDTLDRSLCSLSFCLFLAAATAGVTYSLGPGCCPEAADYELWCAGSVLILLWMFLCPWERAWADGWSYIRFYRAVPYTSGKDLQYHLSAGQTWRPLNTQFVFSVTSCLKSLKYILF